MTAGKAEGTMLVRFTRTERPAKQAPHTITRKSDGLQMLKTLRVTTNTRIRITIVLLRFKKKVKNMKQKLQQIKTVLTIKA